MAENNVKSHDNQVIAIIGPTSSGKSDMAIKLAKKFNGEIVSADSRQIYKELNLCTGKITKKEQNIVRHHCLDIVTPPKRWKGGVQPFTLADYRTCADRAIQDIWSRGKVPFLVGGTQLYVRAVLYDYDIPSVPPDHEYRNRLEKKSLAVLQKQLYQADTNMRDWNDRDNKRRVMRALEIYRATKRKPSEWYLQTGRSLHSGRDDKEGIGMTKRYDCLQLCIDVPRATLYKRIDKRVDERIKKGMIREVERLRKNGVSKKWLQGLGLESRFISEYLDSLSSRPLPAAGKMASLPGSAGGSRKEMIERLKFAIHHYARRQLTWYRKQNDITYVTSYSQGVRNIKKFMMARMHLHA
ncbi:tRNA (adenosine(37)-N6)-dimethylallyltransferase MiaA [Candidatus Uhrbacteria bacterium]|nr:tRNA (adenosine(37)-N6)-dimethylallyltransferase MiaA [Candidatus Uhrbacteria bacterium]